MWHPAALSTSTTHRTRNDFTERNQRGRSAADWTPRYTTLHVDEFSVASYRQVLGVQQSPRAFTHFGKTKREFCCTAVLGKTHNHTVKTRRHFSAADFLSVIMRRRLENPVVSCDLDLWPFCPKTECKLQARGGLFPPHLKFYTSFFLCTNGHGQTDEEHYLVMTPVTLDRQTSLLSPRVEKFWKSVNICRSYGQLSTGLFYETRCT